MANSQYFRTLKRGIAHHRNSLLKDSSGAYFVPAKGSPWIPSRREQSLCDAFIFFVNAEIETYFEGIIAEILQFYEDFSLCCPLRAVGSHSKMHELIIEKKQKLVKNHHILWDKTYEFWHFLGLSKSHFPDQMWDKILPIARYRGDVAHQAWGIRVFTDPRTIFSAIAELGPLLERFDRDFTSVRRRQDQLLAEMRGHHFDFVPGLGTLATTF